MCIIGTVCRSVCRTVCINLRPVSIGFPLGLCASSLCVLSACCACSLCTSRHKAAAFQASKRAGGRAARTWRVGRAAARTPPALQIELCDSINRAARVGRSRRPAACPNLPSKLQNCPLDPDQQLSPKRLAATRLPLNGPTHMRLSRRSLKPSGSPPGHCCGGLK